MIYIPYTTASCDCLHNWEQEQHPISHMCRCKGYTGTLVKMDQRHSIPWGFGTLHLYKGKCDSCGCCYWTCSNLEALVSNCSDDLFEFAAELQYVELMPTAYNVGY